MPSTRHSILPQAETFLQDAVDIPILKIEESTLENYSFSPKDYNSSLSVSTESICLVVIVCYDASLIDKIVKNFMEISSIDDNEKEELYLDASGEIINIVLNLANPKYIKKGETASMNTPIKITSINDIQLCENNSILNENIYTEFGEMSISIISSKKIIEKSE